MLKHLSEPTGEVAAGESKASDSDEMIVRPARLVHSGENGEGVAYQSADGETKPFDAARIQNIVDIHNKKYAQLAKEYGGEDKIPVGACEPILDNHESDSTNRIIGRLTGRLKYAVQDVPKVGKNVSCAIAEGITWLGAETVKKVKDGRLYHLSIGIDEENDELGETSAVITPAAPGAMLLKHGGKSNGGQMSEQLNEQEKSLWKRLMKKFDKKLAQETSKQSRYSELKSIKDSITKLSAKSEETKKLFVETGRKGEIISRLKNLTASGKMTPAEYRNLVKDEDLKHLSTLDEKTLNIALKPYEAREKRVIDPTQKGTTAASEVSDMTKLLSKDQKKKLRSEIFKDMKKLSGKEIKLKEGDEAKDDVASGHESKMAGGNKEEAVNPGKSPGAVEGEGGDEKQMHMAYMAEMKKHLEAGDIEKAKEVHEKMAKCVAENKDLSEGTGDVKSEDYKKGMSDLQLQIDEQNTQMGRVVGMLEKLMSDEPKEGHGLSEEDEDGKTGGHAA